MTNHQNAVFTAVKQYGPVHDAALVPLVQHLDASHPSSSSVRSRRAELVRMGRIAPAGEVTMPSGRRATLWVAA